MANMGTPKQPSYWNDENYNQDDHPVVGISWFEARAYCRWNGKELPTEAQWEKAARGPEGYEWLFGNDWDKSKVNSGSGDNYQKAAPVDTNEFQANTYGLHHMSGNVREWVQDIYQAGFYTTTKGKEANPVNNTEEAEYRVLRGGSWSDNIAQFLRASVRYVYYPYNWDILIGFRCARTL